MADIQVRRTQLRTPASDTEKMASAADSGADEVFLDLEDSVAPNEKADARTPLIGAAHDHEWDAIILSYRINGIETQWWYEDIIEVVSEVGDVINDIIIPKVK